MLDPALPGMSSHTSHVGGVVVAIGYTLKKAKDNI